jgi:acetyl esterase/lipase
MFLPAVASDIRAAGRSVFIGFVAIGTAACNRPPAGFYETQLHADVAYVQRGDQSLCMDIVEPIGAEAPRPAVLLLHGGGWILGDRSYELAMARFLGTMGYTAATASYRLCNERVQHPAPVQDALAAVKFLRANAGRYGIDSKRIAIGGESAGGHLALLVGLTRDPGIYHDDSYLGVSSDVCAVIDIYGPTLLGPRYQGSTWIVKRFLDSYLGGPPEKFPERYAEASPLTHVRGDAPPVLIVHGDLDNVVDLKQAEMLEKSLRACGGRCALVRVAGAGHGWGIEFTSNNSMRTLPAITHFLARVFAEPR